MPSRSRPFYFTLLSKTGEKIPVAVNGEPARIDATGFTGYCHIVHDTGSETGPAKVEPSKKRGLIVQMQGKFAQPATLGEENSSNIWLGGTLGSALNLGWVMRNVVSLGSKFANKKTGGRFYIDLGNEKAPCQMGFHLRALFRVLATPEGEQAPRLGSPELDEIPYEGPGLIEVDTSKTYTLYWKIPYLDLCTWELLKVPAISPLPLENVLGDLSSARLFLYDLGKCGASHPDYANCVLVEAAFERGEEGGEFYDARTAEAVAGPVDPPTVLSAPPAVKPAAREVQAGLADSESIADSLQDLAEELDEESRELNGLFERTLQETPHWKPGSLDACASIDFRVPFYIEAIDRYKKQKVRTWYALRAEDSFGEPCWQARDSEELAALCRPKRRFERFPRGTPPRNYMCCGAKTLEQFRLVVIDQLSQDSKLRSAVIRSHGGPSATETPTATPGRSLLLQAPRFFTADGTMCGLAFAQAWPGRSTSVREALVGALHYEGRACEELLRLSSDNVVRCFSPYDCDQPRVCFIGKEILKVEALPGRFMNRFPLWEVQTSLRSYVFCCAEETERDAWVASLRKAASSVAATVSAAPTSPKSGVHSVTSVTSAKKAASKLSTKARGSETPSRLWPLLDSSNARRWEASRLVLNDRLLTSSSLQAVASDAAAQLLEQALSLGPEPSESSITQFLDASCLLKGARLSLWGQAEKKAFWLNVYHCLLLHGLLVLNPPDSQEKLTSFRQRASYLVGQRPVSLQEIETEIFYIPSRSGDAAPKEVEVAGSGGCCGLFAGKKTAANTPSQDAAPAEPSQQSRVKVDTGDETSAPVVGPIKACLYLDAAEDWEPLSADPRLELAMASGTGTFGIPVLRASSLEEQLNEAARRYVKSQVQVQQESGVVRQVSLPSRARSLQRHFQTEQELLRFLWRFQSDAAPALPDAAVPVRYRPAESPSSRQALSRATEAEAETTRVLAIAESAARDAHMELLTKGYGSVLTAEQLETLNVISL